MPKDRREFRRHLVRGTDPRSTSRFMERSTVGFPNIEDYDPENRRGSGELGRFPVAFSLCEHTHTVHNGPERFRHLVA